MAHFNEENTVEQMVLDTLCGCVTSNMIAEELASYDGEINGWRFVAAEELPRLGFPHFHGHFYQAC